MEIKDTMAEAFEENESTHYTLKCDQDAEWALQKIKDAEAEKAKWKAFYAERYKAVCESCDLTIQNMSAMLQTYFESVPHKVTKTQENYTLPGGKLVCKRQEPEFTRNDVEVIGWLKDNGKGNFVKTEEALDWGNFKKTLTVMGDTVADEDGQIIPGITATQRPDVFKVELKKED